MKTVSTTIENATKRVLAYTSKLKYKTTFKYVKGLTKKEKTLANICLSRQLKSEMLILNNDQLEAFGIDKVEDGKTMTLLLDVNINGKLTIYPYSIN